jgi:hypothetical protein
MILFHDSYLLYINVNLNNEHCIFNLLNVYSLSLMFANILNLTIAFHKNLFASSIYSDYDTLYT